VRRSCIWLISFSVIMVSSSVSFRDWCGVVWCDVVWCGVAWCGVAWCGSGMLGCSLSSIILFNFDVCKT
jgi:hypothetical protein